MHDPAVSIIIPCYNGESHVGEAIRSALDQTHPRKEIIVIDDGSTDGSWDTIRSFGDAIRAERCPHRGAAAARNHGLRSARGEYVQFLDADDVLYPGKLACQVEQIERTGADLVFCNGDRTGVGVPQARRLYRDTVDCSDPLLFVLRNQLPILSPLHRRERLHAVGGFREELPCSQERDLNIRLACMNTTFHYHPDMLFCIRRQSDSLSANYLSVLDQHLDIARRAAATLREQGTLTDARARALARFLAGDARHYFQRGKPGPGLTYLREACALHPGGALSVYGFFARQLVRLIGPERTARISGLRRRAVRPSRSA